MKLDFSFGMTYFCLGEVQIKLSEDVYMKVSIFKFLTNATLQSMEVIFHDKGQLRRSSNLVFTGQHYLEIVLNGSSSVTNAREWVTSIEMHLQGILVVQIFDV